MASNNLKTNLTNTEKKAPTGIEGFDEIIAGGLPRNRPALILGDSGCGKTIMSLEFLVNGAKNFSEPGVFMSFEETREEIISNLDTMNFDIASLIKHNKLYVEYLEIDDTKLVTAGHYDLEGIFVRLDYAIKKIGAKRVVLDSLDALFFSLDGKILRQEIKRLFKWLKEKNVTAIITAAMENGYISKNSVEQYVADCVIALDHRVINRTANRRLRILKMRGSVHGTNEYPFIISEEGISILPMISQLKSQPISSRRISSGIADLDGMLGGKGFFQGSSILVSGSAGTGKTSIAISFIHESCKQKMRSLYCAFEESASQVIRNMNSIGLDIEPYVKSGLLHFYCSRPTLQNLELHLISIKKIIKDFQPEIVILDPVTNLMSEGINSEIRQMLTHFVDFLKELGITTLFTAAITLETIKSNPSDEGISAMMHTWILLNDTEKNSERNRGIYVLKSRGMSHSAQVREFIITNEGISLLPVYIGASGILTGTAKLEQTLQKEQENILKEQSIKIEKNEIESKRKIMEQEINILKARYEHEQDILLQRHVQYVLKKETNKQNEDQILALRSKTTNQIDKPKKKSIS